MRRKIARNIELDISADPGARVPDDNSAWKNARVRAADKWGRSRPAHRHRTGFGECACTI